MGTKNYNGIFELMTDLMFFVAVANQDTINMAMLPLLAKVRYPWFVENWKSLYPRFVALANGDAVLESALEDFDASVKSSQLGNRANILENSVKFQTYAPFLETVALSELILTPAESVLVDQETQRISGLAIEDIRAMRDFLNNQASVMASAIGLGDPTAAKSLAVGSAARIKGANIADMGTINDILQLVGFVDGIIFAMRQTTDKPPNLLEIANQNISPDSDVSIADVYSSYVSVPFEISLESMAQKYLGSKDMWYELVTVNNLRPPYVDEVGEKLPLLTPGAGNNVLISANRRNDIHVGTKVMVGSYSVKEEPRFVERILFNSDNTMVLFLSGNQDLFKLKITEAAFVRVYTAHTVNTGSFILIPLIANAASQLSATPENDTLRRLDRALLDFGVDIAQGGDNKDILVDANGNFVMAYGLKNVRQAVDSKLSTVIGELPFHAGYGLDLDIGARWFGAADEVTLIVESITDAIMADARFTGVEVTGVEATGTGLSISMLVTIAGTDQVIPLAFVS